MKKFIYVLLVATLVLALIPATVLAKGGGGKHEETAGNNLSFPVIWAEGVMKALRGAPDTVPIIGGAWWWWWGTEGVDPNITPLACAPDPDNEEYCDDGIEDQTNPELPPDDEKLVKVYLQKDVDNVWQAGSADWSDSPVFVDKIDWGDNLESVDWYLKSQVRTEVVLFEDLEETMTEYGMRHVSGWGIDEVHGLAVDSVGPETFDGTLATIYSHCARLTIQKLVVDREDPNLQNLVWVPADGWTEPEGYPDDLINPHIFNGSVHEGGDGPGYYSAEINVKGRIIYGYTWNVKKLNEGAGDYRITFSFDEVCGENVYLNTSFDEYTEIIIPLETEEVTIEGESEPQGGAAVLDLIYNLTYIDIRILNRR